MFSDNSIRLTGERDPYLLGLVPDDAGRAIATPEQAECFAAGLEGGVGFRKLFVSVN